MTTPCEAVGAFADGELEPENAAAFREHLAGCAACERELLETMQLTARLSTLDGRRFRIRYHAALAGAAVAIAALATLLLLR